MLSLPTKACEACNGEGTVYEMIECGRSMSDCCGGCTRDVRCETCGGSGQVEDWDDTDEI